MLKMTSLNMFHDFVLKATLYLNHNVRKQRLHSHTEIS